MRDRHLDVVCRLSDGTRGIGPATFSHRPAIGGSWMSGPEWLRWLLTGAFLAVSAYCVGRLVAANAGYPGCARAGDLAHVLIGIGMAGMVSPTGAPLPPAVWETVFLLLVAWFVGAWVLARGTPVPDWHGSALHH